MARKKKTPAAVKAVPAGQGVTVPVARYDAAGSGRRLKGWNPPASGPNRALQSLPTLRNRTRDIERNEWTGANAARSQVTNLIGVGIICRPKTKNPEFKARQTALWESWIKTSDADGVLDFYGQQSLATRSMVSAGEVFARLRPRRPEDKLPAPLQIQLLESDMLPMLDVDTWPGMQRGNKIRSGIELDRIGRRVAYWMYRQHPGDRTSLIDMQDLVRVPAQFVRHIYEPIRPGQLRGVSEFAPVLAKLRGVGNFDDAVLMRQELANLFAMFVTRPESSGDPNINPVTGLPFDGATSGGTPMAALEPGITQELMPGEGVTFSDPPDAGANYGDFMRHQHLGVAAGQGLPYELLTGDIKDVSDRTLRVVINEFRRRCEQRQWQVIIPMLCQPVRDAWADACALAGLFTAAEAESAKQVHWQPQGWAYIHPVQDVQAKKHEVDSGFRSRSSVISERGDDPEQVDAERKVDEARYPALMNGAKQ